MNYDPHYHPYPSYQVPVYAKKGMISTSQPLAAQAGLDILKKEVMLLMQRSRQRQVLPY